MSRYALVAALALAMGAAGTVGASKLITGKDIKNRSLGPKEFSKKAVQKLEGKDGEDGAPGAPGAPGADGINGAPGASGTSGSTAPSLTFGTVVGMNASQTLFTPPSGGSQSGSEGSVQTPVPPGQGLIARDFSLNLNQAPGANVTVFLRVNGADTGLGCTVGPAATSCEAAGASVALNGGDKLSMRLTTGAIGGGTSGSWSFRVVF